MAFINRPKLPAKVGYVEDEVDGIRTYRNVSTGLLISEEAPEAERLKLEDVAEATLDLQIELINMRMGVN